MPGINNPFTGNPLITIGQKYAPAPPPGTPPAAAGLPVDPNGDALPASPGLMYQVGQAVNRGLAPASLRTTQPVPIFSPTPQAQEGARSIAQGVGDLGRGLFGLQSRQQAQLASNIAQAGGPAAAIGGIPPDAAGLPAPPAPSGAPGPSGGASGPGPAAASPAAGAAGPQGKASISDLQRDMWEHAHDVFLSTRNVYDIARLLPGLRQSSPQEMAQYRYLQGAERQLDIARAAASKLAPGVERDNAVRDAVNAYYKTVQPVQFPSLDQTIYAQQQGGFGGLGDPGAQQ